MYGKRQLTTIKKNNKEAETQKKTDVADSSSVGTMKMVLRVENLRDELALVYKKKFDRIDDEEKYGRSRSSERIMLFENYVEDLNEQVQMLISLLADSENKNIELSKILKSKEEEEAFRGLEDASDTSLEIANITKKLDHSVAESETNTVLADIIRKDQQKLHNIKDELFGDETPLIKDMSFQILETYNKADTLGNELAKALTNVKALETLMSVTENSNEKHRLQKKLLKERKQAEQMKNEMLMLIHDSHMMESLMSKMKQSQDVQKGADIRRSNENLFKSVNNPNQNDDNDNKERNRASKDVSKSYQDNQISTQSTPGIHVNVTKMKQSQDAQKEADKRRIDENLFKSVNNQNQNDDNDNKERNRVSKDVSKSYQNNQMSTQSTPEKCYNVTGESRTTDLEEKNKEDSTSGRFISRLRKTSLHVAQPFQMNNQNKFLNSSPVQSSLIYNELFHSGKDTKEKEYNNKMSKTLNIRDKNSAFSNKEYRFSNAFKKDFESKNTIDTPDFPPKSELNKVQKQLKNDMSQTTPMDNLYSPQRHIDSLEASSMDKVIVNNKLGSKVENEKHSFQKTSPVISHQQTQRHDNASGYFSMKNSSPTRAQAKSNDKEHKHVYDNGKQRPDGNILQPTYSSNVYPKKPLNSTNSLPQSQNDADVKRKICNFIENIADLKHIQIKTLLETFGKSLTEFDHVQSKHQQDNTSFGQYLDQEQTLNNELISIKLEAKAKDIEYLKEGIESAEKEWDQMKNIVTALKSAENFDDEKKVVTLIDDLVRTKTLRVEYLESLVSEIAKEVSFLQKEIEKSPFKPDDSSYRHSNERLRVKLEMEVNRMRTLSSDLTSAAHESATLKSKFS